MATLPVETSDLTILQKSGLFAGIDGKDLPDALRFLNAVKKRYAKDRMVFHIGDKFRYAGIVLSGIVSLSFLDEKGDSVTMNHFSAGSIFGESLALAGTSFSPVQMQALTDCTLLFLDVRALLTISDEFPSYRKQLYVNLLRDFAAQNVFLNLKVRILGQKKLRDRIKLYLQSVPINKSGLRMIRFNRAELAEFLGVNRSALSRELSRMQSEEILVFDGNKVRVLDETFLL